MPEAETLEADLLRIADAAEEHRASLAAAAVERVVEQHPLDAATRRNLEVGTLASVDLFIGLLRVPDRGFDPALFRAHGRAHQAAGRTMTELLALYRQSALGMWQHVELLPGAERLTGPHLFRLGSTLLSLVDSLSTAAMEGYLEAGAEVRRRDRARRDRLLALLLSDPPEPRATVQAAAELAGWALPERIRVAVAAVPLESDAADRERTPARVLSGPLARDRCVLLAGDDEPALLDPLLQRAATAYGAAGPIALGPPVPAAEAARSAQRAAHLLDELEAGHLRAGGATLIRSEDHELPLLLAAAPELVDALVARRLAPLDGLPAAKREQTLETLGAWLADPHRPQAIADRLGMHVQSVRYRLARLRDLFGDDLDDPDARFELQVALRAPRD